MAIELRRILLDPEEFEKCIELNLPMVEETQPGKIVNFEIIKKSPLEVVVHLQGADGKQAIFRMDDVKIMAVLINHCIENGIPMPRKAKKTINYTENGFTFDMHSTTSFR